MSNYRDDVLLRFVKKYGCEEMISAGIADDRIVFNLLRPLPKGKKIPKKFEGFPVIVKITPDGHPQSLKGG